MLNFYELSEKVQTLSAQLSWSHYCELLSIDNIDKIKYYISVVKYNNLSVRQLREKINSKEYERLPDSTKEKLISNEETNIKDFIPNPIIIKNRNNYKDISEKALKRIILDDIESFMKELGNAYTFVGSEYKIKIGNRYNYIDLLLFNYEYNAFVVVELKVTELKKEHIGQIEVYMNYIDKNIKKITHDKTIGLIICKEKNEFIIEYSSDKRIIAKCYELV